MIYAASEPMALRYALARNIDAHKRWAVRTFIVVSGVWFFRVGLMLWKERGLGVCRKNRISPCSLRELRVSVLKLAKKKMHHGGTENTEKLFSDRLLEATR